VWRHTYLAHPYLLGAQDERVAERFKSIFMNLMELSPQGQLSPVPIEVTDEYMQVFTHMREEYETRHDGHPPDEVISEARLPLVKYFENGTPIGIRMFEGYKAPNTPILVKYGKKQFLEPMIEHGELRLANAGLYNDSGFLDSVRDHETSRTFFIPTFRERLAGETHLELNGHRQPFDDDDIVLPLIFDDYYLFSLCEHIHYRMPTDFEADAAIPTFLSKGLSAHFWRDFPVGNRWPVTSFTTTLIATTPSSMCRRWRSTLAMPTKRRQGLCFDLRKSCQCLWSRSISPSAR
jgi:hypothetical protein